MKFLKKAIYILSLLVIADSSFAQTTNLNLSKDKKFVLKFNSQYGIPNWTFGFSDSPLISNGILAPQVLFSGVEYVPINFAGGGLLGGKLDGHNISDDLFTFAKKKISGLIPNTDYKATFQVQIATNAASGCNGVGGSPGEGVTVKAGATTIEPLSLPKLTVGPNGHYFIDYVMNIDKGNQAIGGKNAISLGNVAGSSTECKYTNEYELKELSSTSEVLVKTNFLGEAWVIVGFDSGFEARSKLYITRVEVDFK